MANRKRYNSGKLRGQQSRYNAANVRRYNNLARTAADQIGRSTSSLQGTNASAFGKSANYKSRNVQSNTQSVRGRLSNRKNPRTGNALAGGLSVTRGGVRHRYYQDDPENSRNAGKMITRRQSYYEARVAQGLVGG